MAFCVKREGVKQVPWFSLTEWHQVYKQIYSNDTAEQAKAHEMLLAWKARIPKLPVGVDSTLSIIQVCLKDCEWTPKINKGELSISYENDLCLMYSTAIMRFLNHICNIGHMKQTSLFKIAEQLKIPYWIVVLRHDAAHGHELPSIGVLRQAANTLLTWLHEEYWAAEAKTLEECHNNDVTGEETEGQAFDDLIELWTAVNLYIHIGFKLVSDIPDCQLQETLQDLRSYAIALLEQDSENTESDENECTKATEDTIKDNKYSLATARTVLLSELSRYLNKKSIPNKEDIVFNALFSTEAFLPSTDIIEIFTYKEEDDNKLVDDVLPIKMVEFWKDIIFLLHENGMMEALILRLLKIVDETDESQNKRSLASLWISSIAHGFLRLSISQRISQNLEYEFGVANKQLSLKKLERKIGLKIGRFYPYLKQVLRFNLSSTLPNCLMDMHFISNLILNANEFSVKFISPILELVSSRIDKQHKQLLLNLVNTYTVGKSTNDESTSNNDSEKTFTVEDIRNLHDQNIPVVNTAREKPEDAILSFLDGQTVHNPNCELANANYKWSTCPVGVLPWQIESLEVLSPLKTPLARCNVSTLESNITPGIIDNTHLKMRSHINWNKVLREKRRIKRRHEQRDADIIINKAMETAKRRK